MKCTSCGFEAINQYFYKVGVAVYHFDPAHRFDFRLCPKCGVVFDARIRRAKHSQRALKSASD